MISVQDLKKEKKKKEAFAKASWLKESMISACVNAEVFVKRERMKHMTHNLVSW